MDRTAEILHRFEASWSETELHYKDLLDNYPGWERTRPVLKFIEELRAAGWGKYFRLGTSIHRLIISRSVNFGLRADQKYVMIEAYDNQFEVTLRDGYKSYRKYRVDNLYDERVMKLLETLKGTLVD
ncbi:hypothetical protein [Mucilaginibacter pedocola]|uniref:DUF5655 domain-containing protein n=1 Tax=Mucilaginibacter pedocola TaxID=1792845 RepID=A0A1S9PFA6_9SPHI|nr:hypothetical protein [Mucilaginibacter pedocola]OOQ59641.1 hypothetical protein BC343_05620 [Mucilaginibacter pedocola]